MPQRAPTLSDATRASYQQSFFLSIYNNDKKQKQLERPSENINTTNNVLAEKKKNKGRG